MIGIQQEEVTRLPVSALRAHVHGIGMALVPHGRACAWHAEYISIMQGHAMHHAGPCHAPCRARAGGRNQGLSPGDAAWGFIWHTDHEQGGAHSPEAKSSYIIQLCLCS